MGFLPVVSRFEQNPGFEGPLGPVAAGEGRAGYTIFRLGLRRSHYFYLVHSRYLIGGFGVGLAVPQTRGRAGASFTGMGSVRPTLGGKVGLEYPVNQHLRVGVASDWNVIWYGKRFVDSAFLTGYGLHVSALR